MNYGHIKDSAEKAAAHASFADAALGLPSSASLLAINASLDPLVLSQTNNDCVANALAKAVQLVRAIITGESTPLCARRPIYYWARAAVGDTSHDEGCMPSDALYAAQMHGLCDESVDSYATDVNAPPDVDVYRSSYDARGLRYQSIDAASASVGVRTAIAVTRRPVLVAWKVDDAFENWTPNLPAWTFQGPPKGGHYTVIVAYRAGESGPEFGVLSSWGIVVRRQRCDLGRGVGVDGRPVLGSLCPHGGLVVKKIVAVAVAALFALALSAPAFLGCRTTPSTVPAQTTESACQALTRLCGDESTDGGISCASWMQGSECVTASQLGCIDAACVIDAGSCAVAKRCTR